MSCAFISLDDGPLGSQFVAMETAASKQSIRRLQTGSNTELPLSSRHRWKHHRKFRAEMAGFDLATIPPLARQCSVKSRRLKNASQHCDPMAQSQVHRPPWPRLPNNREPFRLPVAYKTLIQKLGSYGLDNHGKPPEKVLPQTEGLNACG